MDQLLGLIARPTDPSTTFNKGVRHTLGTSSQDLELGKPKTVFYLAYGSNLSDETFLGKRNIRPLSATNVVVPSLRMTFDIPGIPYHEPCFAGSAWRNTSPDKQSLSEKDICPLLLRSERNAPDYHKDRWHKGLVGVVYEVTEEDYAKIIATEAGYVDIVVNCFPLSNDDTMTVPDKPEGKSFQAHTLFSPNSKEDDDSGQRAAGRPDPSYAQPSVRYLKLITDGAQERKLPIEYRQYLADIRPYTITTRRQQMGQNFILMTWTPFIMALLKIRASLSDKDGKAPAWVWTLAAWIFSFMWMTYDKILLPMFGDGERTIDQDES